MLELIIVLHSMIISYLFWVDGVTHLLTTKQREFFYFREFFQHCFDKLKPLGWLADCYYKTTEFLNFQAYIIFKRYRDMGSRDWNWSSGSRVITSYETQTTRHENHQSRWTSILQWNQLNPCNTSINYHKLTQKNF